MSVWRTVVKFLQAIVCRGRSPVSSKPPRSYNLPMHDGKFHLIGEVKVGELDDELQEDWDAIRALEEKLQKLHEKYDHRLEVFWESVQNKFGHHVEEHEVTRNIRISEEGDVYVDTCKCPICQSVVHGMTVQETVEAMYKNDLIPHHVIDDIRERAKAVDSQKEMRKKALN